MGQAVRMTEDLDLRAPWNLEELNSLKVLRALRARNRLSKRALGEICGLSRPTVDKIVDGFLRQGLVRSAGYQDSLIGRHSTLYEFNAQAGYALGVDCEIPNLNVALVDLNGRLRDLQSSSIPSKALARPKAVLSIAQEAVESIRGKSAPQGAALVGLGFGIPGLIRGSAVQVTGRHLPQWRDVPLGELLQRTLNTPVFVDNDANFMALAEGHRRDSADEVLAYLALRPGVAGDLRMGGAVVIRGEIFRGAHGNAVMLRDAYAEPKLCPTRWSRPAVHTLARRLMDPIVDVLMAFDPSRLVINARLLGDHEEAFLDESRALLRAQRVGPFAAVPVEAPLERERACAKGAAIYVLQDLFRKPEQLTQRLRA